MDRQHVGKGITGGLLLIGLGAIWLAGWWWPGIMVVLGIAVGAGLAFRGRFAPALLVMIIFFGIPLLTQTKIPWHLFAPLVLIGVGAVILAKAFFSKESLTVSAAH